MKKLNKDSLRWWQEHLAQADHEKPFKMLTSKQQKHLMEVRLPQEIDREPFKT